MVDRISNYDSPSNRRPVTAALHGLHPSIAHGCDSSADDPGANVRRAGARRDGVDRTPSYRSDGPSRGVIPQAVGDGAQHVLHGDGVRERVESVQGGGLAVVLLAHGRCWGGEGVAHCAIADVVLAFDGSSGHSCSGVAADRGEQRAFSGVVLAFLLFVAARLRSSSARIFRLPISGALVGAVQRVVTIMVEWPELLASQLVVEFTRPGEEVTTAELQKRWRLGRRPQRRRGVAQPPPRQQPGVPGGRPRTTEARRAALDVLR